MTPRPAPIELLEARIAPALTLRNPLSDLLAGPGKTGASVDLSEMFDAGATNPNRTIVEFTTNFDTDTVTPGIQAGVIRLELFDDLTPLTVQNFLNYVNSRNARGDYDGTFFHRAVTGFVLQGGGFNSEGSRTHVDTGLPVHNEFDASRPNVRGTITMAKTGLSPHTATSEFFFNLANNSANLDNQNGGFTVFGNVIQGLGVIDAIVALPRQNIISADFGAPVQNYFDPDGNAATVNPVPTADQLIRITDTRVIPATPGNATGITFSVENVFQAGTTTPSDLVSGTVSGTTLNLKYKPGATGAVDVVVKAVGTDGPLDIVTDTFRVTVQPNVIASFTGNTLPDFLTAGATSTVKLQLSNSGGGIARGTVDIHFSLAEVNTSTGLLATGGERIAVGEISNHAIAIASGGTATIAARLRVPAELASDTTKVYRLIAEVDADGALGTQELFSDDNLALNGNNQGINQFGGFTARGHSTLTYVEADGDRVTFTLTGGGIGQLAPDGAGGLDLNVVNTTATSKLSARIVKAAGGDGRIALDDLNLQSVLQSASLGFANVSGNLAASGGLRSLQLGDLEGPGTFVIGAFLPANTAGATITLGRVSEYRFESAMPVTSFTAQEWLDADGAEDALTFLSLGRFDITGARGGVRGDLQAEVRVFSSSEVKSFRVAGFLQEAGILTIGDVGSIVLGGIDRSNIGVGVTPLFQAGIPLGDADLGSFSIKGIAGFTGNLFIQSQITAATIGTATVQKVDSTGGSSGFVADAISRYNRIGGPLLGNLDDPATLNPVGVAENVGQYFVRIY
jgi:cyclophilin family peptidyl-prolyl cis-trans isomerase